MYSNKRVFVIQEESFSTLCKVLFFKKIPFNRLRTGFQNDMSWLFGISITIRG